MQGTQHETKVSLVSWSFSPFDFVVSSMAAAESRMRFSFRRLQSPASSFKHALTVRKDDDLFGYRDIGRSETGSRAFSYCRRGARVRST
jgi:hypothetical protein